jgi:8-oxo-dGTP diphosphatase
MLRVAIGIIRDASGRVLVAKRPDGRYLAGLWEFPGGKLEDGEASRGALVRELHEELGVEVSSLDYLTQVFHEYPDFSVAIDVWLVESYEGVAAGCEGQELAWVTYGELQNLAIPPANSEVLSALIERGGA